MTLWQLVREKLTARQRGEQDAPNENAGLRPFADGSDVRTQDATSTTGTTANETFVGRAGGDEAGDVGESGAERRAAAEGDD